MIALGNKPPPLANNDVGNYSYPALKKESVLARAIVLLKAQGCLTDRQIAEQLDCNAAYVGRVLKQPWARELMLQLMHSKAEAAIEKKLSSYANEAIEVAYQLMQSGEKEETRAKAAFKFLDLQIGQKVKVAEEHFFGDLAEEERRLEEALRATTGLPPSGQPDRPTSN